MRSWDVKLAGEPYVLVRGGLGISLGPKEPAPPRQVSSIVIESLDGGIGPALDRGRQQYVQGTLADLTVPGTFSPTAQIATLDTESADSAVFRPRFGWHPTVEADGSGQAVVISGHGPLYTFEPTAAAPVLATLGAGSTLPADSGADIERYNGSSILLAGTLVIPAINLKDSGSALTQARVTSRYYQLKAAGGSALATAGQQPSYGALVRRRLVWVRDKAGLVSQELYWAPMVTDNPDWGDLVEEGPWYLNFAPHVTWVYTAGDVALLALEDRTLYGFDESGFLGTLSLSGLRGAADPHFGNTMVQWGRQVVLPSDEGLWFIEPRTMTARLRTFNEIQGASVERLRGEVLATATAGERLFVALRTQDDSTDSFAVEIVDTDGGMVVHDLLPEQGAGKLITDFLPFWDATLRVLRLYFLVWDTTNNNVILKEKKLRGTGSPFPWTAATIPATSSVQLPRYHGQAPAASMTKRFLQVRGYFDDPSGSGKVTFTGAKVDGQDVIIGDVTANGSFAVPITAEDESLLLGRAIEMTVNIVNISGTNSRRILLPLVVDFVWVPTAQDYVKLQVLLSSEVHGNVSALWTRQGPKDTSAALAALRGTVVELEFAGGQDRVWQVVVEDVETARSTEGDALGTLDYVATIYCRRVA